MSVRVRIVGEMGAELWEGEMPQVPARGDTLRMPGKLFKEVYGVSEIAWTPAGKYQDVTILAVSHGRIDQKARRK